MISATRPRLDHFAESGLVGWIGRVVRHTQLALSSQEMCAMARKAGSSEEEQEKDRLDADLLALLLAFAIKRPFLGSFVLRLVPS